MKVLITGICGFVGTTIAKALKEEFEDIEIIGIDNFFRSGSWVNRDWMKKAGIAFHHGDIRLASDLELLPKVNWVIDTAANPSVSAGVDGRTSSLQLIENNVLGTVNILEYCKRTQAGFILLSTSRVYSLPGLTNLELEDNGLSFRPKPDQHFPVGISPAGVRENYSTLPPVSLYGSTKVASEHLALEYGETYGFPVWINRCGVMAGAGQFGHPLQGIFAYWIHSFKEKRPLKYIGFGGSGYQVRDCLHPKDLISLLSLQFREPIETTKPRIVNVSGGLENSMSLKELTQWCEENIGDNVVLSSDSFRKFDIPWMVLDYSLANSIWNWRPKLSIHNVLDEIAVFSRTVDNWTTLSE